MSEPSIPSAPEPMNVEAFIAWALAQPEGQHYELQDGRVVAMAPERAGHARLKAEVWAALRAGIRAKGLRCEAFPDGMTVRIDERTAFEPDALVRCGDPLANDTVVVPDPVLVVEVRSPSTGARDAGAKLADYFRLPSIVHYLIVRTDRPAVIHHRRATAGSIETTILGGGTLVLDPPGLDLDLDRIYREAAPSEAPP
jgi:Uma2 family endonuclease